MSIDIYRVAELSKQLSDAEKGGQGSLAKFLTEVNEDELRETLEYALSICVEQQLYEKASVIRRKLEILVHIKQKMSEGHYLVTSEGTDLQGFMVSQN